LPPEIKTKSYNLIIELIRAEKLIKLDSIGNVDPYVVFDFGSSVYKTKKKKGD